MGFMSFSFLCKLLCCFLILEYFVFASLQYRMAAGNAHIGKPAPDFTAKAVMPDGQFKDLKLSDYRGMTSLYI